MSFLNTSIPSPNAKKFNTSKYVFTPDTPTDGLDLISLNIDSNHDIIETNHDIP